MAVFPAGGGENRINTAFVSIKNNLISGSLTAAAQTDVHYAE